MSEVWVSLTWKKMPVRGRVVHTQIGNQKTVGTCQQVISAQHRQQRAMSLYDRSTLVVFYSTISWFYSYETCCQVTWYFNRVAIQGSNER